MILDAILLGIVALVSFRAGFRSALRKAGLTGGKPTPLDRERVRRHDRDEDA